MEKNKSKQHYSVAFSLIELMVVVAIIGVLAFVALPQYLIYMQKATISKGVSFVDIINTQARIYEQTHGVFPTPAQLGYPTDQSIHIVNAADVFGIPELSDSDSTGWC